MKTSTIIFAALALASSLLFDTAQGSQVRKIAVKKRLLRRDVAERVRRQSVWKIDKDVERFSEEDMKRHLASTQAPLLDASTKAPSVQDPSEDKKEKYRGGVSAGAITTSDASVTPLIASVTAVFTAAFLFFM
mmetsp:Transcript_28278/g.43334  ORF Transcript_28278/g.43334 Transcript_28278/m.43334 type:complete len:133 (-) Transcript_28278:306-704(-)